LPSRFRFLYSGLLLALPSIDKITSGMAMRLGKIEKHILAWAYRRRGRSIDFVSKTGAMLSYVRRHSSGRTPRHTYNLKALLTEKEYRSLHTSFFRAIKTLAAKGLVERVYYPDPQKEMRMRFDEWGKGKHGEYGWLDLLGCRSKRDGYKRYIRKSVFCLTAEGRKKARAILKKQRAPLS